MSRVLLVALLALPGLAHAWGFDGHRRLASKMQDPLPATSCLKAWFTAHQTAALQDDACDPDRWRTTDAAEWPRHFLEVDWVTPITAYPREWADAQAQLGQYADRDGTVPWRVEEYYGLLVSAFRTKNTTTILNVAFILSHYVTDAFSILHDTRNFDPNGLHARWESDMLAIGANLAGITTLSQSYFGTVGRADPRNNIFDVVIVGNGLVNTLVQADTAHPGDMPGFYAAVKDLTARRWGDALTLLSSLLWSAWAEAGAPELTGFSASCSRAVPSGEIVLRGYPVPGGFTHPAPAVDGGVPFDAGSGGGAGGGSGEADGGSGAPPGTDPPPGCGCGAAAGASWGLVALIGLRRGRRRLA